MTEHLRSPVQATYEPRLLEQMWGDGIVESFVPGAFAFEKKGGNDSRMWYVCPTGCGRISALRVVLEDDPHKSEPTWVWDGNEEKPTLHPSIHHIGHWHGFLRAGIWVDA